MPQQPQQLPGTTNAATTTNGGPRVSFNRDVHVKRIGKRPNEPSEYDYETTDLQPPHPSIPQSYHQLPPDIDPEDIRKEAALVIAQAGQHQSKADNGDKIPNTFRVKQKRQSVANDSQRFHSLPNRRKGKGKPVARSVSDAAAKKPASKRPSIFGLFSRKSDTNVNQLERDPRFEDGGGRRLVRSKSDVGSTHPKDASRNKLGKKNDPPKSSSSTPKQQLSPIIEQSQREDFFEQDYFRERERRKSDAVTDREKNESELGLTDLISRSRSKAELDGTLLNKHSNTGNNTTGPSNISAGIRDRIENLKSKSSENMHSSQLPAERLPLTKGRTVNGLVKRLSMERFSPQPVISQPAFSYIRPNEGITYAQLDHSEEQQQQRILARDSRTPQRDFAPPPRPPRANDKPQLQQQQYHPRSYSPMQNAAATSTRLASSLSPSPWQQLSPRNLSDEDEGLGFETRKVYYEDDFPKRRAEPPIVPIIRSVSPAPYLDELGYRRAQLENRILTRRFGEGATLERQHHQYTAKQEPAQVRDYYSPERERERERERTPERELVTNERYHHRPVQVDVPDSTTMPKMEKSSRYRHTKYYDDGHGGVKETYVRETQKDGQVRESRHRERLGSSPREPLEQEQEPKSLDSQLTGTDLYRSSPELRITERARLSQQHQDYWQSSLKRDKLQQRSFDKGDSGIENDFRKESFNGDLTTRWRKRTPLDDMRACESFLRKERRESAQQLELQRRQRRDHSYIYRERSIDDGSHFDPHLDKYPVSTSTLRRREQESKSKSKSQSEPKQREETSTLKRNKKLGGFEKVKQLFTGTGSGSNGGSGRSSGSNVSSSKKDTQSRLTNGTSSTLSRRDKETRDTAKDRERYMVREEEMRLRYREHQNLNGETSREPKTLDISMRRRLSTPKASPLLLKRGSTEKPPKKKETVTSTPVKRPEKTGWFKSLDRRAKSNPKEQLNVSVNGHSEATSSLKRTKRNASAAPAKNLRFFGDTDLDSNPPTISKASSMPRRRTQLANSKHSQSAYNLDRSPPPPSRDYRHSLSAGHATNSTPTRQRATSMQHLEPDGSDEVDFRKRRHYSRSRELHDISESGSEPEPVERHKRGTSNAQRAMSLERSKDIVPQRFEEDRPLLGPPKPARSTDRRGFLSSAADASGHYGKDRERYPAESSGTEGESSLHSQRSVVYLHATTVGDIPQPYNLRRRSMSREDLRKGGAVGASNGGGKPPLQPMTRTVSRSVSMLAPWKPKHISEGYEINYSQEQNKRTSTLPRKPPPHNGATSASTLNRLGRKQDMPTRRHNGYHIDERPTPPASSRSLLSASNLRTAKTK